jgi:FMN phosphatase YigB (HAD superfamily)
MRLTDFKALTFDCYGTLIAAHLARRDAAKP